MFAMTSYDWICVSSSAGKDSQAMLHEVVRQADCLRIPRERIVVIHSDLGRAEWKGTKQLAQEQAAHYGVRFIVCGRSQDLLDHIRQRGMFPSSSARYCTSDHKRDQIYKVFTQLANEYHGNQRGKVDKPCRILNAMGLRAEESTERAKRAEFAHNKRATTGRKHVDDWLPIHSWDTERVWSTIRQSGVRHHEAYDQGMQRLSCCFCVLAPKTALKLSGRLNPELLAEYVAIEQETGHSFKANLSLAEVQTEIENNPNEDLSVLQTECESECWKM